MKEIKIKEQWIYKAMNREIAREYGLKLAMCALAEELELADNERRDIWNEIYKRYKLDAKKRYSYIKKGHIIRETFDRVIEPAWMKRQLDKKY